LLKCQLKLTENNRYSIEEVLPFEEIPGYVHIMGNGSKYEYYMTKNR